MHDGHARIMIDDLLAELQSGRPLTQLQLRFIATGGNQHVFEDRHGAISDWVFKTPSAFGELTPWDHSRRLRRHPPRNRLLRIVYQRLFAPTDAQRAVAAEHRRWHPDTFLERCWAAYIGWNARRRFRRMLRLMDEIAVLGGLDLLVPFQGVNAASIHVDVDGTEKRYTGPLLMQKRVQFRRMPEIIAAGDWHLLVEAQQRLWRLGFAVADVVRYTSWVIDDYRPRLADGDSLTNKLEVARSHVSDRILAEEEALVRKALRVDGSSQSPEEYLSYVREHINLVTLQRHWRADVA
jgi:hypothetical protein